MIKKITLLSIAILLFSTLGLSQNPGDVLWEHLYGGSGHSDNLSDVKQTADSGYIAVGSTFSNEADPGVEYLWVIRTNAVGDTLWTKYFGNGGGNDAAKSVEITHDGNFVVAGETGSYSQDGLDAWILKLDSNGDAIWTQTYSGTKADAASSVIIDKKGYYVVTGYTKGVSGIRDALLLKYDSDGNLLWDRTYGGTNKEWMNDLCQTEDGNYVLTGYTTSFGVISEDLYLIKTDENGDTVWTKTYGAAADQNGHGIDMIPGGGAIVAGWTGTFLSDSDIWLLRIDEDGDTLWTNTYHYGDWDQANKVICTFNGGYLLSGKASGRFMAMKTSEDGAVQWIENSLLNSVGQGIVQNTEGDYVIAGQHAPGLVIDAILLKLKGEHVNQPPGNFLLLLPENEDTLTNVIDPVEFVWETSFDPDNDNIYYTLKIFNRDTIKLIPFISDTTYSFDGSEFFEENEPYDWTVSASDGQILVHADTFSFVTPLIIGMDDFVDEKKQGVKLFQNYPNPFNSVTTIPYQLSKSGNVELSIYNTLGQRVETLINEYKAVGTYSVNWDANKNQPGLFFVTLNLEGQTITKRIMLAK